MASDNTGHREFDWTAEMNVGIELIDEQHQQIFRAIATLAAGPTATVSVRAAFEEIHALARTHFQTEEQLLIELGHPLSPSHVAGHAEYLERSQEVLDTLDAECETVPPEIIEFVRGWWVRVLLDEDAGIRMLVKNGDIESR